MSGRGIGLLEAADAQIRSLIDLFSTSGDAALRRSRPGRRKLGDGTVGACALHTADSYERIAALVDGRGDGRHHSCSTPNNVARQDLLERLAAGRRALGVLGDLSDEQLDTCLPSAR